MHEEPMGVNWFGSFGTAGIPVEFLREVAAGGRRGIFAVSAVPGNHPFLESPGPCPLFYRKLEKAG